MKKILSVLTLALVALATSVHADEWTEDARQAMSQSKEEKKLLLINFTGSDWCHWCKKIEGEIFSDKVFKDYATENLVLLKLDFPNKIPQSVELKAQNRELANQFGIKGFPTIIVMNEKGDAIGNLGYTRGGAKEFIKQLEAL